MNPIKNELQHLILRNGEAGKTSTLKKTQNFLRGYAKAGFGFKEPE